MALVTGEEVAGLGVRAVQRPARDALQLLQEGGAHRAALDEAHAAGPERRVRGGAASGQDPSPAAGPGEAGRPGVCEHATGAEVTRAFEKRLAARKPSLPLPRPTAICGCEGDLRQNSNLTGSLTVWPWASHLTSSGRSFPAGWQHRCDNPCKCPGTPSMGAAVGRGQGDRLREAPTGQGARVPKVRG